MNGLLLGSLIPILVIDNSFQICAESRSSTNSNIDAARSFS